MDDTAPTPSRGRGLLLIGTIFLLGMISGAALFYLGQRSVRPEPFGRAGHLGHGRGGPMRVLMKELDLDAEQEKKIRAILEGRREEVHRLLEASRAEIQALLTPEQRKRFDEIHPGPRLRPGGPHRPPPGPDAPPPPPPEEP